MVRVYEADQWEKHLMGSGDPFPSLEPIETEIEIVDEALAALVEANILPHTNYDKDKMLAHRAAVRENYEIPWTGISPRMERLLYAMNTIAQPHFMVAMGVFCGYTFICNGGAAIGPGACYRAERLVGIEIDEERAALARRNVSTIDLENRAEIVAGDGIAWLRKFGGTIDLLYIDADSSYYGIIREASARALRSGSLVLAHNSVDYADSSGAYGRDIAKYLKYVRDPANSTESVNVIIDAQGLEVSLWR